MQLIQNNQRTRLRDQDCWSHDHDRSQNIKLVVICSPMTRSQLIALTGKTPEIFENAFEAIEEVSKDDETHLNNNHSDDDDPCVDDDGPHEGSSGCSWVPSCCCPPFRQTSL